MYIVITTATVNINMVDRLFPCLVDKKEAVEYLYNRTGWIVSPDEDKDSLYDFNVRYHWKIIANSKTSIVSIDPVYIDLFQPVTELGTCTGDYIEVSLS